MVEKRETLKELSQSLNQLFFRARGFYAFQNERELERAYVELESLQNTIKQMNALDLSAEEREPIADLSEFLVAYENEVFPNSIAAVRADDYALLRELSRNGTNSTVNAFVAFADESERASEEALQQLNQDILAKAELFAFVLTFLFILLFIIISMIILQALNDIVKPLERMRESIEGFVSGEEVSYKPLDRSDELGVLSLTFHNMIKTIQSNQEELTTQNQALLLNREELQEKQSKLEESLKDTETTKDRLIHVNALNHVLSFTLDKQQLANATRQYFNDVYDIDTGVLWLPKTGEFALT